jgi:trk system potassium uptake protein TrkH
MSGMPKALQHPARLLPLAFLAALVVGTGLLLLPVSRAGAGSASPLVAFFTASSSVFITGMAVVDTSTYWSPFGQVVILVLVQVGGFGIMTFATLLGMLVSQRLALRTRLVAQAETRTLDLGDVRRVLWRVLLMMVGFEAIVALLLTVRFRVAYDDDLGTALWHGVFHAITSFNNAGFALYPDSLMRFVGDVWICAPIAIAVILGGLGFPVIFELYSERGRPRSWSTHTRITVWGTGVLLLVGIVAITVLEWTNPRTLGVLDVPERLLAGAFQGVMPRTAGFNSVDYAGMRSESLAATIVLMFIGGGSAGTSGGIKVTTFFLLAFVILAEIRGEPDVTVGKRRIGSPAQRQALTVALLGVGCVAGGTLALLVLTDQPLERVLFEATSAFATTGLSTGITPQLPPSGQLVLVVLMFLGRVGTITAASAIALRHRTRRYRLPEERPIVG